MAQSAACSDDPLAATFLSSPWTGARGVTPAERRFAEREVDDAAHGQALQFRVAVIGGVGFWPYHSDVDGARLLYVATTRATHKLVITSSKHSAFSERLRRLCAPLAA